MTPQPPPSVDYTPQDQTQRRSLPPLAIVGIGVAAFLVIACCIVGGVLLVFSPTTGLDGDQVVAGDTSPTPSTSVSPSPRTRTGRTPASPTPTTIPSPSPKPRTLTVPDDLVGQNAQVAYEQLTELGFTKINFGSADSDNSVVLLPANWTVVEVAPEPGTKIRSDSTIVLTCTKQR